MPALTTRLVPATQAASEADQQAPFSGPGYGRRWPLPRLGGRWLSGKRGCPRLPAGSPEFRQVAGAAPAAPDRLLAHSSSCLTANPSRGEREKCLVTGMNGYLVKPFQAA